ncbi:putative ribonuclease H protein [Vitis vinifera]|uniref:Putative ribonuclease H protein n=1 Tax=Vitis vinifera TaxID=29760 RepID=A0A438DCF5_VITVI|nr:putative ribonuclease H protein [Vitis vinifera]
MLRAPFLSKGKEKMRNIAIGEDGAGVKGFVGCSHSGSSVSDHPSYPANKEKGLNFEVGDYRLGYVGNPNHVEAMSQLARLNLLSESFKYDKTNHSSPHGAPILGAISQGDSEFSQMSGFQIEGLSPSKMAKVCECVGGDFNVIRRRSEKLDGSGFTSSMRDFDGFIRECELHDPPLRNASFTWSNMQESPVCKRLDRFLYSNESELSFPQSLQEVLPRWTSDHWLIVLDTNPFKWGPTPFRFENMWLQHHSFKECSSSWWREFVGNGWEGHKFKEVTIPNIDAIEQEGALSSDLAAQRVDGDCNSKLFHKVANGRRNRNFIKFLENERGLVLDNSESITEEILLYFKKLYSSPPGESWRVEGCDQEDLERVFAEFHNSGIINQNTNASFIVLLPKKSQSKKISDFRPISLITCLYKVIAKVLSGRLRGVLHETIHSTQGEEGVVFKIDFEKANDHVKWDFLDHVLEKKGFSSKCRQLDERLSVVDVLSRMLLKAEERSLLEGFRVGRNRCRVSHLQFADDTILFANSSEEELQTLKSLLLVFGQISGLKVNLDKSNLFGINLDQNHLSRLALMLDCKASDWPILYLGLPLGGNPTACGFWDPVIERISRRLDGWQKAYLSLGGRITLLHSCLSHIPSYFLSLFKIPASVAAKVERMQRDFLWSGVGEGKRDHLVRWDAVCKLRVKGGLGIGKIPLRNHALLGKWLWRFPRESTTLWHQVILSIYGTHSNGWDANTVIDGHTAVLGRPLHKIVYSQVFLYSLVPNADSSPFFPTKFVWKSQVPFKVKAFVWLVAHKKLAKMDWVPPKSISDMMFINYKEMLGYLRTKLGIQRIFGIPFISLRPFGLFVQRVLRASPLRAVSTQRFGFPCRVLKA